MISVDEALAIIARRVVPLGSEIVALEDACGRMLAKPLTARNETPRQPLSAMDGYAVIQNATLTGVPYEVIGQSLPGCGFAGRVEPGQAVRIFTGAPLPAREQGTGPWRDGQRASFLTRNSA